ADAHGSVVQAFLLDPPAHGDFIAVLQQQHPVKWSLKARFHPARRASATDERLQPARILIAKEANFFMKRLPLASPP
ncbi:MAG: hypothetical protein AB7P69_09730, partial [Candidatus Binatia bacterium]